MSKKKSPKRKKIRKIILIALAVIFVVFDVIVGICLFVERPAEKSIETYQSEYCDTIISIADDDGVEILPQNIVADTGLIFYVGAQIKPSAYIPLLARIAEQGYACFVPNLTFNMALLESNAADDIIMAHPEIKSWYFAGHSIGGYTIGDYVNEHRDIANGLILIAAYTNNDMRGANIPVLSIYGDKDGVLNKSLYEKLKASTSDEFEEHIIAGGNHAGFGDYGKQPRDNDADISAEDQQEQTAEIILDWLNRH